MKICWLILAGILLLPACAAPEPTQVVVFPTADAAPSQPAPPTAAAGPAGLTPDLLKNFTYSLKSLPDFPVTLENGQSQMNDPGRHLSARAMLMEPVALGDLNGDGLTDAVVVVAINTGGSGTFHELIAVLWQNGKPVQAANYELGDRVQERGLKIESGKISLDYMRHGSRDPLCCPSEHALVTFQFKGGAFQVLDQKVITP